MNNFQKQQDKKMREFTTGIMNQVKELVDKREAKQLEQFELSIISCLSNKSAQVTSTVPDPVPTVAPLSSEQTQIIEAANSIEPINSTQPTSTSPDSSTTSVAPEKRRRKYKTLIRDLPIMGNRECIEQSQLLSQVFDCDDTKGRYNLRRRVQVPVVYDEHESVGDAVPIKKECTNTIQGETQEFAWWDGKNVECWTLLTGFAADDATQADQPTKPAKKRGRKRKADLISKSAVPPATTIPIENLCNTNSSLGPVTLEDCPDEVDGDFNWVRVFHKVQKLT